MKYCLTICVFFFSTISVADDLVVVNTSNAESTQDNPFIFLRSENDPAKGLSRGWGVVASQLDTNKLWNGVGNPALSIEKAVDLAFKYQKKKPENHALRKVELRSTGKDAPINLWFYVIEFHSEPIEPGYKSYSTVILSSGQIVEPKYYDK